MSNFNILKVLISFFFFVSCMFRCFGTGGDRERMTTNHETYLLMASTQNDMEDWVKTIRRVIWAPFGGGQYNMFQVMLSLLYSYIVTVWQIH